MHAHPEIAALLRSLNNPFLPGIQLSLSRMVELLAALGNPEKQLPPIIHLAGTNGKGSTLAFLRAIYEAEGYRVHTYTSPHLVRFNERVVIAGSEISDDYLRALLTQIHHVTHSIHCTFFEATTALAFLAFAENSADVVLLETGLGGRLDAMNVIAHPLASVITPIAFDHMDFLGNTLGAIAGEKAGIMKHGSPCFVGKQEPEAREVIKRKAREVELPLILHGRDWSYEAKEHGLELLSGTERWHLPAPALDGQHQYHNAALASVVAMGLPDLPVGEQSLVKGVASARWPARMQRLRHGALVEAWGNRGEVYLDGGHNPHAAEAIRQWMIERQQPITLVLGMMKRKEANAFLAPLAPLVRQCFTVPILGDDAFDPAVLAQVARGIGMPRTEACASLANLPEAMRECGDGALLITGSLFLAGEVLKNHS
jgi:dihydrofolate synthase/folylpolyglutamate synthase